MASQNISLFGSSVVGYAIMWYITLTTQSGVYMTISIICGFVPQIIISPFAGVWADKYNRKNLIMISDAAIAVSTLVLAIIMAFGFKDLWFIFFISVIRSLGAGIQTPAVGAILPQIVPEDKLIRVNGINSTLSSAMMLVSPAVGGLMLSLFAFEWSMFLDVGTAIIAITILFFLKIPLHKKAMEQNKTSALTDLKEGLRYVKNHKLLKYLLAFYAIFFFLVSPGAFLTPLLVARSYGTEVWKLTANEMVWSGGAVLGGIIVAWWGGFKNRIYTMALTSIVFGIGFFLMGVATSFIFYLSIMLCAGIVMPLFVSAETVLVQERVEENMLGRVFSLINILTSIVMPAGMLIFGPLADIIKIEYIVMVTGVMIFILGLYMLLNKKIIKL